MNGGDASTPFSHLRLSIIPCLSPCLTSERQCEMERRALYPSQESYNGAAGMESLEARAGETARNGRRAETALESQGAVLDEALKNNGCAALTSW